MRDRNKYLQVLFFVLSVILVCGQAFAAESDIPVELKLEDRGNVICEGTGFIRGEDLWVPSDLIRSAGVPLRDGPNGKGFMLDIQNPADVFDIPEISVLAGNTLPLYFSSLSEKGISYFNVRGMEKIINITAEEKNGEVIFHKTDPTEGSRFKSVKMTNEYRGKLLLVWAHITRDNPYLEAEEKIDGLDVVLPTWFNLTDANGGMANRASAAYVEAAHKKGYSVWALFSNSFSKALTTEFFKDEKAMNICIARILAYSKLYNLDGINIDFENVDANDRAAYVRFMSKLCPYLSYYGLKSSVDVHVPGNSNLSRSHDRGGLAKYVDYVMLMAYDEHWRTAPQAGSVASMPWVERAVQNTLKEGVPPKKLILGVPFYMRKWEETPDSGKIKVRSYTLTMPQSDEIVRSKGLSLMWFKEAGQHFYSYSENGKTYKVWVEDEESIAEKMQLVNKYGLAGAAAWRKGHEKNEIWPIMKSALGK
jgi:spore germination protein YaaH